jgi:hypothetical protein
MATPRERALGVDLGLGALAVLFGSLAGGLPASGPALVLAGLGAVVFVVALFVAERVSVLRVIDKNRPASLILAGVTFTFLGAALAVGRTVVVSPSATLLWGTGFGLCVYRGVFGLLYSLPNRRLRQAEQWGTLPDPDVSDEPPP